MKDTNNPFITHDSCQPDFFHKEPKKDDDNK